MAIKLLIADSRELIRAGLHRLLGRANIEVVAGALTAAEVVRLSRKHKPDVILLGPDSEQTGPKALKHIRQQCTRTSPSSITSPESCRTRSDSEAPVTWIRPSPSWAIHVDRNGLALEQPWQALDVHAEDRAAHVVLVVVGHQGADDLEAVLLGLVEHLVDGPGRVDDQRLA